MTQRRQAVRLGPRELTWSEVDIRMQLDFFVGWRPPTNDFDRSRSKWQIWEEFLNDWQLVRAEGLAQWQVSRAEQIAQLRRMVAQRGAAVAQASAAWGSLHRETSLELATKLLASAERSVAETEGELVPYAEELFQRAIKGGDPEEAARERRQRLDAARRASGADYER
jgi:hypothetical protein